jgi:hypothetical protein
MKPFAPRFLGRMTMVDNKYVYVGRWCGPRGIATAELIAPDWIITAPHVVKNKIQDPDSTNVSVCFDEGSGVASAGVVKAFLHCWEPGQTWEAWKQSKREWEEVALGRLDHPLKLVSPVDLAANLVPRDATVKINIVGTTIRDDPVVGAYCEQDHRGRYLRRARNGRAESKRKHANPGDSGGGWLVERLGEPDVLVGIVQGLADRDDPDSGAATPPALCHDWIDSVLRTFGAEARWVPVVYR